MNGTIRAFPVYGVFLPDFIESIVVAVEGEDQNKRRQLMYRVLMFEPLSSGHRMVYIKYLLQSIARFEDIEVTLVTGASGVMQPEIKCLCGMFSGFLDIETISLPEKKVNMISFVHPMLGRQYAYYKVLQNYVQAYVGRVDYVFVPFLDDYFLWPFAFDGMPFGQIPWGGIVVRPRHHLASMGVDLPRRPLDVLEGMAYSLLLRNKAMDKIYSIDPLISEYYKDGKVEGVPDPADICEMKFVPGGFEVADDLLVLLVYGSIDTRKGLDRLFKAALDDRVPKQLVLLIVGKQAPSVAHIMRGPEANTLRNEGRLVEIDRYIDGVEEAAAFHRADMVWVYYPKSYGSSGALVRAGQMSVPVIGTAEGIVGNIVKRLSMGVVANEDDQEGLVHVLAEMSQDEDLRIRAGNAGFAHFSKATPASFADPIITHIREKLILHRGLS